VKIGKACFVGILAGTLITICAAGPAIAEVRIRADMGGQIKSYLQKYAAVRDGGERLVVDGTCMSACTLALGLVPRDRICVTRKAVLGFHAAWDPSDDGRQLHSEGGTALMMSIYPAEIRTWIERRGGLNRKTMLLRGRELAALYPTCS
jgi:hypothetical protein